MGISRYTELLFFRDVLQRDDVASVWVLAICAKFASLWIIEPDAVQIAFRSRMEKPSRVLQPSTLLS